MNAVPKKRPFRDRFLVQVANASAFDTDAAQQTPKEMGEYLSQIKKSKVCSVILCFVRKKELNNKNMRRVGHFIFFVPLIRLIGQCSCNCYSFSVYFCLCNLFI